MEPRISEADWKILREVRVTALERFCERVLSEVNRLATDACRSSHQRYWEIFDLLQKQDKELANTFDNPRRSIAIVHLSYMRLQELLTEEEFARFSSETQSRVQGLLEALD